MGIADYCYEKGMTIDEYEVYEQNIKTIADAIKTIMLSLHKADTGVYYNLDEVLPEADDLHQRDFIIQKLKHTGVEFFDDNTLYRI